MKLWRGKDDGTEPGNVRRVTGTPGVTTAPLTVQPADAGGPTPVGARLRRLAQVVDGGQRGPGDRNVRKIMQVLGMLAVGFGFVTILLGWYGAAHSPYQYEEIPYVISGGLLGLALIVGGGILILCAWSLRQVEEARRNAVAIVRSVDRLERLLRAADEDEGATPQRRDEAM
jgi:hypothetical protein